MPTIKTLDTQIEDNIKEMQLLSQKGELASCILIELETNRLIHERNYTEIIKKLDKMLKNNVNLAKLSQKLEILDQKITELSKNKGFWNKTKSIFNK